jgi:hypothetical protein
MGPPGHMTAILPHRIAIQPAVDLVWLSLQPTFDTVRGDKAEAELSRTWSKDHHTHRWPWVDEQEEKVAVRGWKVKTPTKIREIGLNPGPLLSWTPFQKTL